MKVKNLEIGSRFKWTPDEDPCVAYSNTKVEGSNDYVVRWHYADESTERTTHMPGDTEVY